MPPRVSKEHDERRNELLDAGQRLFIERGYEDTPVSAIIDAVGVAKGTFYHYFKSKEDLLDALVERLTVKIFEQFSKSAQDSNLGAIDKLNRCFSASSRWKAANIKALAAIAKPAYAEGNTRLRRKLAERSIEIGVPVLADIFRQGIEEGVFDADYPEEVAEMVLMLAFGFRELHAKHFIDGSSDPKLWRMIVRRTLSYEWAIERMLGAPKGSVHIVDKAAMKMFRPPDAEPCEEEALFWDLPEGDAT